MSAGDAAAPTSGARSKSPPSSASTQKDESSRNPTAPPIWKDPILIAALVLWVGYLFFLRGLDHNHTLPTLSIMASDLVAMPGETIDLQARVSRQLPSGVTELAGIEVELRLVSEEPGTGRVKTDASGIARRTITAPVDPGIRRFAVFIEGEYTADPAIYIDPAITVLDPTLPIFFCEAEAVAPPGGAVAAQNGGGEPSVSLDAVAALRQLSEGRQIVFISTGDAKDSDRWRGRFRLRAVPQAPILADRRPDEGIDDYRRRVLTEGTARFGAPAAVITHSATGCFVYREAGIPTVVLRGPPCDGAIRAESWESVRATISEWLPTP